MTELYTEHLSLEDGITHNRYNQLADQDRRPQYESLHVVKSESEDRSYLVGEVTALNVPFTEADVAEDRVRLYLCGCDDHWYNQSDSIENPQRNLSQVGECKHIRSAFKSVKAEADENQDTLL